MEERSLELKKAGLAIPKVLEKNRLLLPYHLYQAKRDWKQIAGEQIAKYSYILDFKDKQVIIAVMNPVYMNYLFMYKNKIIEEINSYVGHRAIADVRFVKKGKKTVRPVYETLQGEREDVFPKETIRQVRLDDDTVARIRQETAHLAEGLREKVVSSVSPRPSGRRLTSWKASFPVPAAAAGWRLAKGSASFAAARPGRP